MCAVLRDEFVPPLYSTSNIRPSLEPRVGRARARQVQLSDSQENGTGRDLPGLPRLRQLRLLILLPDIPVACLFVSASSLLGPCFLFSENRIKPPSACCAQEVSMEEGHSKKSSARQSILAQILHPQGCGLMETTNTCRV